MVLLFTGHSDATVRVTAYSTLGGFLVAVAPISPITFYKAFSQAIDHIEEQTMFAKLLIAVINTFIYLSRFISPVRISNYIEQCSVSPHFSSDITNFIKFLPQSIPLMKNLPVDLLEYIFRSVFIHHAPAPAPHAITSLHGATSSMGPQLLRAEQKQVRVQMAIELLQVLSVQSTRQWHDIVTLDESRIYLFSEHDLMWTAPGEIVVDMERHSVQSPKFMLTVV
jgi:hypothetical protein